MKTLEEQLEAAGLHVFGCCERISDYGPDLLQNAPLLQDFTPAEADILGASMRLVRAEPGQVLIREGDAGDWMLLLLKGTVDVTKRMQSVAEANAQAQDDGLANEAPREVAVSRVAVLRRGAAMGEMSMLDSEPRYSSCIAIEAVEAAALGRHEIALLIRDHPGVGAKLMVKITQLMAQRLRNVSNHLVRLLRKR
ncbi:Crp/Fnr family transcriptional regulator [Polaromonas jejuensis]|uniref:Crp/Fnr family transcriptional regulator n=1 Tax=Polaromonas jejuensis TaxID=457502 RepID=A0ABW0Q6A7_9BURK|nr:cyclic nucleotide-binding domain-containing protein [Polaromonas jejuensis]